MHSSSSSSSSSSALSNAAILGHLPGPMTLAGNLLRPGPVWRTGDHQADSGHGPVSHAAASFYAAGPSHAAAPFHVAGQFHGRADIAMPFSGHSIVERLLHDVHMANQAAAAETFAANVLVDDDGRLWFPGTRTGRVVT